jgi:hypothetical protein
MYNHITISSDLSDREPIVIIKYYSFHKNTNVTLFFEYTNYFIYLSQLISFELYCCV